MKEPTVVTMIQAVGDYNEITIAISIENVTDTHANTIMVQHINGDVWYHHNRERRSMAVPYDLRIQAKAYRNS